MWRGVFRPRDTKNQLSSSKTNLAKKAEVHLWAQMGSRLRAMFGVACVISILLMAVQVLEMSQTALTSSREEEAVLSMIINTLNESVKARQVIELGHAPCRGKEQLLSVLRNAETKDMNACTIMKFSRFARRFRNITRINCTYEELCAKLPWWENVTDLYGTEPVVLGLDTCARYRAMISPTRNEGMTIPPMVRVAGMFNSGTSALQRSFAVNLGMNSSNKQCENLNVPWGKHIPAKYRDKNKCPPDNTESFLHVLPVVIVRDPYRWMNSMCKASYSVSWSKRYNTCPNLVFISNRGNVTFRVRDKMDDAPGLATAEYPSLAHLWSEWYQQYVDADFPRLLVRFEDTLFHAEKVVQKIAECAGLSPPQSYSYLLTESKEHGHSTNLLSAMRSYGSKVGRYGTMSQHDFEFSKTALSPALMEAFHYIYGEFDK